MSLSVFADFLAVGGPYDNDSTGATWVYKFNGTEYNQLQKIVARDGSAVSPIYQGKGLRYWAQNFFSIFQYHSLHSFLGCSVSLSRDGAYLAVGGYGENNGVGAAWIFKYNGSTFNQMYKLVGENNDGTLRHQGKRWRNALPRCGH